MGNNAVKTTNDENQLFSWTEEDCARMGVNRQEAHLAWLILNDVQESAALYSSGYIASVKYRHISVLPSYMRAMRVMTAQFLNAVATPQAVSALVKVTKEKSAAAPARVQAASRLLDHAGSTLEKLVDEGKKVSDTIDLDELRALVADLERAQSDGAKPIDEALDDVLNRGQTQDADDDLSDLLE